MKAFFKRLLNIRPGEGKKTFLLLALHSLFYLGLMWGGFAREALFINTWGASALDIVFICNALLAIVMGILYGIAADRIRNERLLTIFVVFTIVWLGSVWLWLQSSGGIRQSLVYPYFYLVYGAVSDLSTMHILNYINDFYDTRSAKQAIPLMLAGAVAGSTLAGFSFKALRTWIGLANVPLAWAGLLVITLVLMFVISKVLSAERTELYKAIKARQTNKTAKKNSAIANLIEGSNYIRQSGMLRYLSLATFVMVVLMNLLTYQSSLIFQSRYLGNPNGLSDFYAVVDGFSNLGSLVIQSLALSRMINAFGIGTMSLFFPAFTLLTVGLLAVFPGNYAAAIVGRFDTKGIKQSFRNPLDALLYNGVPVYIKARAKGFVNGLVVPLGTLGAGLLLLSLRTGLSKIIPGIALILGVAAGLVYLLSMIKVRSEYKRSLAKMLADEDISSQLFSMNENEFGHVDPNTLNDIYSRISSSNNEANTLFLAELLYKLTGKESIPYLLELCEKSTPNVHASILKMLGQDVITSLDVRKVCLDGLSNPNVVIRRASAAAIIHDPDIINDDEVLTRLLETLGADEDEEMLTTLIPVLMKSGDFHYLAPATEILHVCLTDYNDRRRAFGLRVLGKTNQGRLLRTLVRYTQDESPLVRFQAIQLIGEAISNKHIVTEKIDVIDLHARLLNDESKSVQSAAAAGLARMGKIEASRSLLPTLSSPNFELRRQVCETIKPVPYRELQVGLQESDPNFIESASFILSTTNYLAAKNKLLELLKEYISDVYHLHAYSLSIKYINTPGITLLRTSLQEMADFQLDRVFWLCSALCGKAESQAIRKGLQSNVTLTRANAIETFESFTSPQLLNLVRPLFELESMEDKAQAGVQMLGLSTPDVQETIYHCWPYINPERMISENHGVRRITNLFQDGWVTALAIYIVWENYLAPTYQKNDLIVSDNEQLCQALQLTLDKHPVPLIAETAKAVLNLLQRNTVSGTMEDGMLDIIEKVIFLKEIPFFEQMSIDQLRTIATISEEKIVTKGTTILSENTLDSALYIIVEGKVALQRERKGLSVNITRLTELGPHEYFGETSIFDNMPSSADAVAMEDVHLLEIRQELLISLIQLYPTLSFDLLKGLSMRLRQAEELISQKSKTRAKKLVDFFDSFEGSDNK